MGTKQTIYSPPPPFTLWVFNLSDIKNIWQGVLFTNRSGLFLFTFHFVCFCLTNHIHHQVNRNDNNEKTTHSLKVVDPTNKPRTEQIQETYGSYGDAITVFKHTVDSHLKTIVGGSLQAISASELQLRGRRLATAAVDMLMLG